MLTQLELIERARVVQGGVSYYRVSQLLGVTSAYMSHLRAGERFVSQELAVRLAHLVNLPPAYVLACIEHERAARTGAGSELADVWRHVADTMKKISAAAVAVLILGVFSAPTQSYATPSHVSAVNDLYIMRTRRTRLRFRDALAARIGMLVAFWRTAREGRCYA